MQSNLIDLSLLLLDAYILLLIPLTQSLFIPQGSCSKSLPILPSERVMPYPFQGLPIPPSCSCSQPSLGHQAVNCSQHITNQTHYFLPELALLSLSSYLTV